MHVIAYMGIVKGIPRHHGYAPGREFFFITSISITESWTPLIGCLLLRHQLSISTHMGRSARVFTIRVRSSWDRFFSPIYFHLVRVSHLLIT
jgi:hypothetical protein